MVRPLAKSFVRYGFFDFTSCCASVAMNPTAVANVLESFWSDGRAKEGAVWTLVGDPVPDSSLDEQPLTPTPAIATATT